MEKEKCQKTELRDVTISVRVTKSMAEFMKKNHLSISKIMDEALKSLGFEN